MIWQRRRPWKLYWKIDLASFEHFIAIIPSRPAFTKSEENINLSENYYKTHK